MSDTPFLFTVPANEDTLSQPANTALTMGALSSRLVRELRTRTTHPDGRRENVAEHSLMLAKVAYVLAYDMYPKLDRGKILAYAILHDDVEAYVGDTPTDKITPKQRQEKNQREQAGIDQLIREFTPLAPEYAVYAALYESKADAEARFVRVVDKIMTLLIHIPNDGAALKEHWTFESLVWWTIQTANELNEEYPEYEALISVRTEIAMFLARSYLRE